MRVARNHFGSSGVAENKYTPALHDSGAFGASMAMDQQQMQAMFAAVVKKVMEKVDKAINERVRCTPSDEEFEQWLDGLDEFNVVQFLVCRPLDLAQHCVWCPR